MILELALVSRQWHYKSMANIYIYIYI
jgi:hypothetical protein